MPMKGRTPFLFMYLILMIYSCASAYVLIFTARSDCIIFSDYISSFMSEPESIYIFQGLLISFLLSLIAFIAMLKIPMQHKYYKYLVVYTWLTAIVVSLYWGAVSVLYIIGACAVSYGFYQKSRASI